MADLTRMDAAALAAAVASGETSAVEAGSASPNAASTSG